MKRINVVLMGIADGLAGRGRDEHWAGVDDYDRAWHRGDTVRAQTMASVIVSDPDGDVPDYESQQLARGVNKSDPSLITPGSV